MPERRSPEETSPAAVAEEPPEGARDSLGARIRAGRGATGVSVRGFARRIGVSPSLISQIERDRVTPSVGTLYAIATELGFSMDELFSDAGAAGAPRSGGGVDAGRPASSPVQRHDTRQTISLAGGVRWERLTPTHDPDVDFLYVVYDVGAASCPEDSLIRHGGTEYGFVTSGRLGVTIGFDNYELGPGDSIVFDSATPHRLWTVGDAPVTAIWFVVNRHGDARAGPVSRLS